MIALIIASIMGTLEKKNRDNNINITPAINGMI